MNEQSTSNKPGSSKNTSRRGFLNYLLGTTVIAWFGSILYPVFKYLDPPDAPALEVNSLEFGSVDSLKPNDFKIVRFGRTPVIVLRKQDGEFKALAATCTHLDCIVQFQPDVEQIFCACHAGRYDLEGRNISGPPPAPLAQYLVQIKDEKVYILRNEVA